MRESGFSHSLFALERYACRYFTPEGLKKEKDVDRSQSITRQTGRKLDFIIIGVMAVAIAYFLVDKFVWVGEEPATTAAVSEERPSVAVLPFANRSANEDDAFFVDGIHDDLLSHISKIGSIKIISRTSVLQYRDTTKTIPQIAEELGVATVLEGGVQRAGEQVRINVQLIDARTDEHLWSEIYDRQLSAANIFTIQSEIATAIAEALRTTLSPEEQDRLQAVPTENLAALEAYFLGKQRMAKRTSATMAEAIDYFQRAIELDPDFALAHVGLGDSLILTANYNWPPTPEAELRAQGEAAINRALQLDNHLGEAYASLGLLLGIKFDFEGAEAAFKRALELNPNYAPAYHWYAASIMSRGRVEEALDQLQKSIEIDPLSGITQINVANALEMLGRFDEAWAQLEKIIEINPGFASAHTKLGSVNWDVWGRLDEAVVWYRKGISLDPRTISFGLAPLGVVYLDLGDERQAEHWISRALALGPEASRPNFAMAFLHLYRGDVAEASEYTSAGIAINSTIWWARAGLAQLRDLHLQAGRTAEARARYEDTFPLLLSEDQPTIDRTNFGIAVDLALVLARTDDTERAEMLLNGAGKVIHRIPRLGEGGYGVSDVQIYAQQGRTNEALAALRQAIDQGWRRLWWYYLEHDLSLEPLRVEPEFQAMVAEIKADMAAQLERVREMGASGELEPIPKLVSQ